MSYQAFSHGMIGCAVYDLSTTFFIYFKDQLTTLISAAKEHGIEFIYAISPGLDITFSNQKEVSTLKRKLDQVRIKQILTLRA